MFSLTTHLSYLFGVVLGDGYFYVGDRSYQIRLKSIDRDFIDSVNDAIRNITGRIGTIRERKDTNRFGKKPQWVLIYCDKKLVNYLRHVTADRAEIPEQIWSASPSEKLWFLRGLMDSEGWITKGKEGYYHIGIAMTNKSVMGGLTRLLQDLGIKIGSEGKKLYPSGKTLYRRNFRKPILLNPFTIKRKHGRFRDYTRDSLKYTG